jgi:hypothetical protein
MVIVNYRYRKQYAQYILVYIKVKIIEILKYDLSYMRYYIVIAMRTVQLLNDLMILKDLK